MAYVDKAGDTMTGPLTVKAQVTAGDTAATTPVAAIFAESTNTNGSKRACWNLGSSYQVGADFASNGTRDFYVYSISNGSIPLRIGTNDVANFGQPPVVNGNPVAVTSNGNLSVPKTVTAGDVTSQFPTAFVANESAHSSGSKRAAIGLGAWNVGQDLSGNGTRDFYIYNGLTTSAPVRISATDTVNFSKTPTVNGTPLDAPTLSKAINFRQKVFSLADYGGVPNDNSSAAMSANAAAFNATMTALQANAQGGTFLIPNDRFHFNASIGGDYASGIDFVGAGYNAELVFINSSGTNGLKLNLLGSGNGTGSDIYPRVALRNLRVRALNSTNMGSGRLVQLRGTGVPGSVNVESVNIFADSNSRAGEYLTVINPCQSVIRDVTVLGNQSGPGPNSVGYGSTGIGVRIFSDTLAPDAKLDAVVVAGIGTAFDTLSGNGNPPAAGVTNPPNYTFEGISFNDCLAIGVQVGLNMASGFYKAPGYAWRGGHINAQQYCFRLDRIAAFKIDGVNAQLDYNNNPQAIVFGTGCIGIHVVNNNFGIVDQVKPTPTNPIPDLYGVVAGSDCQNWNVTGNMFGNFPASRLLVWNQNSAPTIRANNNIRDGGAGTFMTAGAIDTSTSNLTY